MVHYFFFHKKYHNSPNITRADLTTPYGTHPYQINLNIYTENVEAWLVFNSLDASGSRLSLNSIPTKPRCVGWVTQKKGGS